VRLDAHAGAVGRTLGELDLEAFGVQVRAVRRRETKKNLTAQQAGPLQAQDTVVLLGTPDALATAETRLLQR